MVAGGVLVRTGQTRGTRYHVPGRVTPEVPDTRAAAPDMRPRGVEPSAAERHAVLEAARRGRVTNETVRDLLGVHSAAARSVLAAMVDDGALQRRGQRRGSHYVIATDEGSAATATDTACSHGALADPELRRVWELAGEQVVDNAAVRWELQVGAEHAQVLLRELFQTGLLEREGRVGERRYTRAR